jgi:hypothetical protein
VVAARTRLIVRTIAPAKFHWPNSIVDFVFWQPAHWITQMRQFQNLERLTSA